MTQPVDRALAELPLLTRAQVLEEAAHNPGFWSYFSPLALSSSPGRKVDDEMMRAAINTFDPSKYREAGRRWPMFQSKLRDIQAKIADHAYIYGGLSELSAEAVAAAAPQANVWSAIGNVLSSIATTAGNIYSTRITTSAQTSIARTQAQVAAAEQQAAVQVAQAGPPGQYAPPAPSGTSPILWIVLGVLGIGGLLAAIHMMRSN